MSEFIIPKKEVTFYNIDDPFKMRIIGYNDFRYMEGWEFFRVPLWNTLHYVREGCGKLFIGGKEYSISAGSFFIANTTEPVMYYPDKENPWCYYWFDFESTSSFHVIEQIGLTTKNPTRQAKSPEKINELLEELFNNSLNQIELYYAALSVVMQIVSMEHFKTFSAKPSFLQDSLVENVKNIIKQNYSYTDFSIANIANMLYISNRHITRVFHAKTGMTPVAYLQEYRLNAALHLLHTRKYTVDELCIAVGWKDRSYFMKCFKKKYGMTVKSYYHSIQ